MHFVRQVNIMARKKIVFVIVEGPSDDEALGLLLTKLFDKNRVYVHITHGDITSEKGIINSNILIKIGEMVSNYASSNHLTKIHFQEIIHIVDTDGVYVPDTSIIEDILSEKPVYSLQNIKTANVRGICERNAQKRKCLDRISTVEKVWEIPYQVYYMSCNLDHVLYNQMNANDKQKEDNALYFARKYRENMPGFVDFITNSDFSVQGDYTETWKYIKQELHSLERHTNLGICVNNCVLHT